MAKVALIERELKREKLVAKYAKKYAELKAIANDADYISRQGERAAEQALMSVNATYNAVAAKSRPGNDAAVRNAIRGLFQQLDNPSAYNAPKFAEAFKALGGMLP